MEEIVISTPAVNSKITCGKGAFESFIPEMQGKKLFVVTDSNVHKLYGALIEKHFKGAPVHVIPAGEKSKNYNQLKLILQSMFKSGATRKTTVVAFGGGVVGDIAGLAASLFMRGVPVVQIPTTLLSQVDSSVGGKTAVDFCGIKNAVGAFYQPYRVVVDPMFLSTLPKRELRCGLGEIVKYGALDKGIYSMLKRADDIFSPEFLESVTAPCIRHKAAVVTKDEKDLTGIRKTLNAGHTVGHAFELYYKRKSHGEFVLIGMYYELYAAEKKGICKKEYANELRALIKRVIKVPAYTSREAALKAIYDKKNDEQSSISMVVPAEEGVTKELILPVDEYLNLIEACSAEIKEQK